MSTTWGEYRTASRRGVVIDSGNSPSDSRDDFRLPNGVRLDDATVKDLENAAEWYGAHDEPIRQQAVLNIASILRRFDSVKLHDISHNRVSTGAKG
jgi:hypothetical protein